MQVLSIVRLLQIDLTGAASSLHSPGWKFTIFGTWILRKLHLPAKSMKSLIQKKNLSEELNSANFRMA